MLLHQHCEGQTRHCLHVSITACLIGLPPSDAKLRRDAVKSTVVGFLSIALVVSQASTYPSQGKRDRFWGQL